VARRQEPTLLPAFLTTAAIFALIHRKALFFRLWSRWNMC